MLPAPSAGVESDSKVKATWNCALPVSKHWQTTKAVLASNSKLRIHVCKSCGEADYLFKDKAEYEFHLEMLFL